MIIGLGTDLVGVERIRGVYRRQGGRFLDRVYTQDEQAYCLAARDPGERLAVRWAAKEAAMKALGTGLAQGVRFTDLVVGHTASGAPTLTLHGVASTLALAQGCRRTMVSLSHSDGFAIATVILEG